MLNMAQIEYIKHLYENEGKSLREIAKITGKDFRTVQKYAYRNDWNPKVLPNVEPENYRVLGPYILTINEWLEQDAREPRKQRHTMVKIFKRLQEEYGYRGSYPYSHNCIEEQLDDFIVALQSFQIMFDARIIPDLSGMENIDCCIGRLVDIGVTDIVTAYSMDGIKDELVECISEDGMQRYKRFEGFVQNVIPEKA